MLLRAIRRLVTKTQLIDFIEGYDYDMKPFVHIWPWQDLVHTEYLPAHTPLVLDEAWTPHRFPTEDEKQQQSHEPKKDENASAKNPTSSSSSQKESARDLATSGPCEDSDDDENEDSFLRFKRSSWKGLEGMDASLPALADRTVSELEERQVNAWMNWLGQFCAKHYNVSFCRERLDAHGPFLRRVLLRVSRRLLTKTQLLDILKTSVKGLLINRLAHRFPWRDLEHTEYEPETESESSK